jgi:hypothetical protein
MEIIKVKSFHMIVVVASLVLVSCDPGPGAFRVGVRAASNHEEVAVAICDDERVVSIEAYEALGGGDSRTVWRVERTDNTITTDSDVLRFTLFKVPQGFHETITPSDVDGGRGVLLTFSDGHDAFISWEPEELPSQGYLSGAIDGEATLEELLSARDDYCDNQ